MPLAAECEGYLGRRILVEPQHGYGWKSLEATAAGQYADVIAPAKFHCVIDRFFRLDGTLIGGAATIREEGHAFDGRQLGFSARHSVDCDFISAVTCNLTVGNEVRVLENGWLLAQGPPNLIGFGQLRDDVV
jgi:hypothetical protein